MTTNKKKKNYKLRRRVKRTIASITMAMAVAVAAIPVENYGRMQAAEDDIAVLSVDPDFNMEGTDKDGNARPYTKDESDTNIWDMLYDLDGTYGGESENSFTSGTPTEVPVHQIDGTTVVDAYKVIVNGNKAIVSSKGELDDVKVNKSEYHDYVMFKAEDLTSKLDSAFFGNTNTTKDFEFQTDSGTVSLSGGNYVLQGDANPKNLSAINGVSKLSETLTNQTITLQNLVSTWQPDSLDSTGGYGNAETNTTGWDWNTVLETYENAILSTAKGQVKAYNDKIAELEKIQTKITGASSTPAELTQAEVDTWTKYSNELPSEFNTAKTLTITKANLTSENGLPKIYTYILQNYYGAGKGGLADYVFIKGTYRNTDIFFAQHKTEKGTGNLDENGYLTGGSYTIVGVKSNAFEQTDDTPQSITNISLPESLAFIGKDAFKNCRSLNTVEIDARGCIIIGDSAFEGSGLNSLTFTNTGANSRTATLGMRAFAKTGLREGVTIPSTVTKIGAGCFEKSDLTAVTFEQGGGTDVVISEYAFFDCKDLAEVTFADQSRKYEIKKGAFAGGNNCTAGDALQSFAFPEGNLNIGYTDADAHDYILAGRPTLSSVTFGTSLNDTIPVNTLRGCFGLAEAHFKSSTAKYETYISSDLKDPQLFSDVTNQSFIVYGPAMRSDSQTEADPRKCSWNGFLGYLIDGKPAPVPYCFTDASGTHIELGYDGGQYIARIDVKEGSDDAVLSKYKLNPLMPEPTTRTPVTIPAKIGNYNIVEIGQDCFEGPVKDKVYRITIEDGHVVTVGTGSFSGCKNLEWVFIGNSVKEIGPNAFSDCTALENVEFSTTGKLDYKLGEINYLIGDDDETWANEISIDETAFATNSDRLTFHGAIHKGYRPFEIAMSANNSNLLKSDKQICYKTDEPLNLTVIRNRNGGKATLVDYPHYQEIDDINREYIKQNHEGVGDSYSITSEFERNCVESDTGMTSEMEKAIVDASLYLELPRGIESINTHDDNNKDVIDGFFDAQSKNDPDFDYLKEHYVYNEANVNSTNFSNRIYERKDLETSIRSLGGSKKDITKLYSEDGYIEDTQYEADYALPKDEKVSRGGLFSGYFNDNNKEVSSKMVKDYALNAAGGASGLIDHTYSGHEYIENYNSGNDYLTKIKLGTVDTLPDYAFDNCENLLTASLGESLAQMGALPFRGCKNVYSVDVGAGNQNFLVQNMMIFANNGDDKTYTLKECLEGRGKGDVYGSAVISAGEFPESVTEIEERAFANCDELTSVDLTNTSIINVPVDCFKNSKKLQRVTLPKTIRRIETGAFVGVGSAIEITVPTSDCVFTADAIDGISDVTIIGSKYKTDGETLSDLYHSYETLVKNYGENKVHFADYGNSYHIDFVDRELKSIPDYSYLVEIKEDEKPYNLSAQQIPPSAPEVNGYDFVTWMCRVGDEVLTGTKAGDAAFNNINEDRLYYPSYEANPKKVVPDGNTYTLTFENATATLVSGSATIAAGTQLKSGDKLEGGSTISFVANDQSKFQNWTAQNGNTSFNELFGGSTTNYIVTFTMPNSDVKVTANLKTDGSGDNKPGGDENKPGGDNNKPDGDGDNKPGGDNNKPGEDGKKYKVTVNYGSGSGEYAAGETVNISAFAPESPSKVFSKWTTNNSGLGFANANSATTSFVMPAADVTVTANYKTRTSDDDDDDDDAPSRRPGNNTNTSTVPNRPGSSAGTTGTTGTVNNGTNGTTTSNDGNKIYITKNGVSNKDVASISVDGSTDNFIVRITESEEATKAVEESLINKYGSLDGLAYFPMDISLYDSTGQHKITDTYGLNITVTMPIPDVLIQYGGNNRVAAADNGNLQQLTPRFTTIDGIACISFVPPHFSPYVIYVDTNNLVAGQTLDSTPSTGDPIHPKWFAAIGMACISILLFVTSDNKKRRSYKAV